MQKRQVCKNELINGRIYSAKNIEIYKIYDFEFPWEKKSFNRNDIMCKVDTYWFDPVEFQNKIYIYSTYVIPIVKYIKKRNKNNCI